MITQRETNRVPSLPHGASVARNVRADCRGLQSAHVGHGVGLATDRPMGRLPQNRREEICMLPKPQYHIPIGCAQK